MNGSVTLETTFLPDLPSFFGTPPVRSNPLWEVLPALVATNVYRCAAFPRTSRCPLAVNPPPGPSHLLTYKLSFLNRLTRIHSSYKMLKYSFTRISSIRYNVYGQYEFHDVSSQSSPEILTKLIVKIA